jgi:hypothetical protein
MLGSTRRAPGANLHRWDRPFPRTGCNLPCSHDPIQGFSAGQDSEAHAELDRSGRAPLDYAGDRYGVLLELLEVGDTFRPDVGYVRRSDIRLSQAQLRFTPRPRSNRVVRKLSWTGHLAYTENGSGRVETRDVLGEFGIEFQNSDPTSCAR